MSRSAEQRIEQNRRRQWPAEPRSRSLCGCGAGPTDGGTAARGGFFLAAAKLHQHLIPTRTALVLSCCAQSFPVVQSSSHPADAMQGSSSLRSTQTLLRDSLEADQRALRGSLIPLLGSCRMIFVLWLGPPQAYAHRLITTPTRLPRPTRVWPRELIDSCLVATYKFVLKLRPGWSLDGYRANLQVQGQAAPSYVLSLGTGAGLPDTRYSELSSLRDLFCQLPAQRSRESEFELRLSYD